MKLKHKDKPKKIKRTRKNADKNSYAALRKKRGQIFGIRIRLMLFVIFELLFSIVLSYIIYGIVNYLFFGLINHLILDNILPWTIDLSEILSQISFLPEWLQNISITIPHFSIKIPLWIHLVIISVVVGIIATLGLSIWLLTPIRRLKKSIAQIADGDFSTRITKKSSIREIQEIYAGFNLMAEQLEATEILQTDFVSNVSHEFKTPINAIEGYSMLLQNDELSEEQRAYVDKILFNTKRLSTLTGSILLLSKLENQKIQESATPFSLDEQIRETIVALEPLWSEKNVELDVDLESIEYFGNEKLLCHVWSNLISNAVKFGPEGGVVRIRLYRHKKELIFTVDDEGEGLSEEAYAHIFDKFYQADSSHKEEGNGLGLTLVKKILDITDGDIYAENLDGKGCRFTVILQKKKIPKK